MQIVKKYIRYMIFKILFYSVGCDFIIFIVIDVLYFIFLLLLFI